jgi:type I restriction enzyme M protein
LRFNLTLESRRFLKFDSGEYPKIKSIITLPKNIYNLDDDNLHDNNGGKGIIFHSEILLFNIKGLESHYFLPKSLQKK